MKYCIIFLCLTAWPGFLIAQELNSIKTDQDCLHFIKTYIKNGDSFYFDTLFSANELKQLNLHFKNWEVFDFNNDKKPDLLYVGRHKEGWFPEYVVNLYLSGSNSYETWSLLRFGYGNYSPLAFWRKSGNTNLLYIYQFDLKDFTITDSLMAVRKKFYPEGIRTADTLVYKYNTIINYASHPSDIRFDSLTYYLNYQQTCLTDSFTVYNNGRIKYNKLFCGRISYEMNVEFSRADFEKLKGLVREIDFKTTKTDYFIGWTDMSTAKLKIYSGGQVFKIRDYGMESTYTLQAIYALFGSLHLTYKIE